MEENSKTEFQKIIPSKKNGEFNYFLFWDTNVESFRSKRGVDESLRLHVHRVKKRRGDTDR